MSDNGSNFVGANRAIKELYHFLEKRKVQDSIVEDCGSNQIVWQFIPEHSPHFGGLWEATVKSVKILLR